MKSKPAARPYFSKGISDLQRLASESKDDEQVLRSILSELDCRSTNAAAELRENITIALEQLSLVLAAPDNSARDESERSAHEPAGPTVVVPAPAFSVRNAQGSEAAGSPASLAWRTDARRPWWARLFQRSPVRVRVTEDSVERVVGAISVRVSFEDVRSVAIARNWYGDRVIVESAPGAAPWPLLRREDATLVAAAVTAAFHAGNCAEACTEFSALLNTGKYLNHRPVANWLAVYENLWGRVGHLPTTPAGIRNVGGWASAVDSFRDKYARWETLVRAHNDRYVRAAALEHADFFARLESNPLTARQVEAVLRDEDHSLVVAGAGTGKTSTVVGKVGFLVESGEVEPSEVLALAFARKAKTEMEERIFDRTGHEVEVRTFHSLGLQIVNAVEKERHAIASMAQHEHELLAWVSREISDMLAQPALRDRYLTFAVYHRHPARYLDDFTSRGDYLRYMRKHEPQTLRGERVKSFEELLIADWLTVNGVRYEYERPYEFNTASLARRQYKPDFYLPDFNIYLEHFGVGKDGETAPGINAVLYAQGMQWKRALHRQCGTRLVESYSWERKEGILLAELARKLTGAGVKLSPPSDAELRQIVEHPGVKKPLVALLKDFLNVFKANLWTFDEMRSRAAASADASRALAFLDLFEVIHTRYQDYLLRRRELDFSDLIARATEYVESGAYKSRIRRLVVDEFQDISRGRLRLLLALLRSVDDARLFCVGDDWQSIFAFTGSDVAIMTRFPETFGYTARTDLDRTFRFTTELLRVSSHFIQKNPGQLSKELVSSRELKGPAVNIVESDEGDLAEVLATIDRLRPARKRASVLLLGRYNFSEPEGWQQIAEQHPLLDVSFLTVHKAKGLEADYVVVLGMRVGRYGFPSEVASDPILALVIPSEGGFEYAEERRLFYVALTRARQKVFVLVDPRRPSAFVEELAAGEYGEDIVVETKTKVAASLCPECQTGTLILEFPNRTKGYAWRCELAPYCEGKAMMCPECKAPTAGTGRTRMCTDPECRSRRPRQVRR